MLLNVSNDYLYFDHGIEPIGPHHRPYFLVLGGERERSRLEEALKQSGVEPSAPAGNDTTVKDIHAGGPLHHIVEIGDVHEYQSFSRPGTSQNVFKVYTDESRYVPDVSTELFLHHGLFTAEHDIQLYFKRAHGSGQLLGQPIEYLRRLESVALAAP